MDRICPDSADNLILSSNPYAQYLSYKDEINASIVQVLQKGRYILGDEVQAFEQEFAEYIGTSYGIGVASGTDALHLALRACDIGVGDEVITVSHTAVATVSAIAQSGAMPVLVDISPDTCLLDPRLIESAISAQTRAIIVVHLYGTPADMDSIVSIAKKQNLLIIEDCAQAHGAEYKGRKVGSIGDVGCFSFYPTKNLGAIGDGGLIVTSNTDIAQRIRLLREYGWKNRYISDIQGFNSRLDEIQAAILRIKLRYLERDNEKRRSIAELYRTGITHPSIYLPVIPDSVKPVFHLFVIRTEQRDLLQKHLQNHGIQSLIHYPAPVHLQPAFQNKTCRLPHSLPITEKVAWEVLSLPMYPELSSEYTQKVIYCINQFRAD